MLNDDTTGVLVQVVMYLEFVLVYEVQDNGKSWIS